MKDKKHKDKKCKKDKEDAGGHKRSHDEVGNDVEKEEAAERLMGIGASSDDVAYFPARIWNESDLQVQLNTEHLCAAHVTTNHSR